jgi:hypothetical protein
VFLLGDLLDLLDGEVGDELLVGFAAAGLEAGLVFDQFGGRRDADLDLEGAVLLVGDGDRDLRPVERFGLVVDLLDDRLDVDGRRPEFGPQRRPGVRLAPWHEYLDSFSHIR